MGVTDRERGVTLTDNSNKYPNHEEVKGIFNETYNVFYKKWKDISNPDDWAKLVLEAGELNRKYPYPLCQKILLELVQVIEDGFKRRQGQNETDT